MTSLDLALDAAISAVDLELADLGTRAGTVRATAPGSEPRLRPLAPEVTPPNWIAQRAFLLDAAGLLISGASK